MRYSAIVLASLLVTFWCTSVSAGNPPADQYLPFPLVDHPVYDYLSRLETSRDIPLFSETRPFLGLIHHPRQLPEQRLMSREARRYAAEGAANMVMIGQPVPESTESSWQWLKRQLPLGLASAHWLYADGFHLASWQYDSTFSASLQPVYGLEAIRLDTAGKTIKRFTSGLRVEGGYAQKLHFMVDFRDHTEFGNGPYYSRSQLYQDRWGAVDLSGGNSTTYDISESFLQYYGHDLSIAAGRGRFQWGPGQYGSLFLNSQMPPFDYIRFDAAIEAKHNDAAIYYTFLHGWLQSNIPAETLYVNPDGRPRTLDAQKYFSAQRLELRPGANFLFGFSQGVIYGDRGVQLGYLTPVNFLYAVQHSMDDKDNFVLTFDGTWRLVRGLKVYGEALFDDITVSALTTSRGTNKSAYTVGMQAIMPKPFWEHFDLRTEYTKIRPFVYSHVFATNTYTNWTSPIGYTLQPNSEFLHAEIRGTFYPVQVSLFATHQNHGSIGGDIYTPLYAVPGRDLYGFLEGSLVRSLHFGGRCSWQMLPNLALIASLTEIRATGAANRLEAGGGFSWNL
jgi:hypothetical protein